jgi:two-component system sensor histidine kinase SenX3
MNKWLWHIPVVRRGGFIAYPYGVNGLVVSTGLLVGIGTLLLVLSFSVVVFARRADRYARQSKKLQPLDRVGALREILDLLPDAAAVVRKDDRVVAASVNCVAMGLVSTDYISPIELRALNREVHRLRKTLSREAFIGRQASGDGGWEARLQLSPLDDNLSLLIAQDLSEERRLNEARRDFVANVSHELKTPVGALSLLAEAINAEDVNADEVRHFANRMQYEAGRLTDLITDLVELSRVQGDVALRHSAPVSVEAIIAASVDDTKFLASEGRIVVDVADTSDVGRIYGDERQLVTAIRNLISNAIKYSPAGRKVGVGAKKVGDNIEITVTDQGPGIPDDELIRIFERFYRVDPSRNRGTGGTGLGLAIVKHICANHGGECTVWSRQGEGSTFTLRFPAYLNGAGHTMEDARA